MKNILLLLVSTLMTILVLEFSFRGVLHYTNFIHPNTKVALGVVDTNLPSDNPHAYAEMPNMTVPSESLGWKLKPGKYTLPFKFEGKNHPIISTVLEDGSRITRESSSSKSIAFIGGSVTFGYGVGDKENFPALVSEKVEDKVFNLGVQAYSTVQSMLSLKEFFKDKQKPSVIIYGLGSFHGERNNLSYSWRRALRSEDDTLKLPYAKYEKEFEIVSATSIRSNLASGSLLLDWLQMKLTNSFDQEVKVTEGVLLELKRLANEWNSRLLIAVIDKGPTPYEAFLSKEGFDYVKAIENYESLPWDFHPGHEFHKDLSEKILMKLQTLKEESK